MHWNAVAAVSHMANLPTASSDAGRYPAEPMSDLTISDIDESILEFVPESIIRDFCVLPKALDSSSITLFCPDEPNYQIENEARLQFAARIGVLNGLAFLAGSLNRQLRNLFQRVKLPYKTATFDFDSNAPKHGHR